MLSVLRLSNELLILSVLRRVVLELFGTWCFIRISCFLTVLLVPSGTPHEYMLILFGKKILTIVLNRVRCRVSIGIMQRYWCESTFLTIEATQILSVCFVTQVGIQIGPDSYPVQWSQTNDIKHIGKISNVGVIDRQILRGDGENIIYFEECSISVESGEKCCTNA